MMAARPMGRLSFLAASLLLLLLGACATTEDEGRARAENAAASEGPDLLNSDNFVADVCEGRAEGRFNLFRYSTGIICDSIFDGLAGGFASIGRNQPDSRFCVAQSFQIESYKEKFLRAMREQSLGDEARLDLMLGDVRQIGRAKDGCDWQDTQTLGPLSDSCSWFEIVQASDPERAAQKRMSEEGIYSDREKREVIGGAMAHCGGYIIGFLMAELFAVELVREPGYCKGRTGRSWEVEFPEVAAMAVDLTKTIESQPERRGEPAGQYFYRVVTEKPRCPTASDG